METLLLTTLWKKKRLKKQTLNLPPPCLIDTLDDPIPYIFVGDEVFSLSESLMQPYPMQRVTDNYEIKVFNYRLLQAW